RVWLGILRDHLAYGRQDLRQGQLLHREALRLREPTFPPLPLRQDQAPRACPCGGCPPIESQRGWETALPSQLQSRGCPENLGGRAPCLGSAAHGLPQRLAEQVAGVLSPAGTAPRRGVQGGAQWPGAASPGLLRPGDRPIQHRLVQVVRAEPQAAVAQRAATAGRRLCAETVHDPLPALVPPREPHRVPSGDGAVGLQPRGQRQAPSLDGRLASRRRTLALGQRLLKVRIEQLLAYSAPKDKEFPRLWWTCSNLLLCRAQRHWRVPQGSTPHSGRGTGLLRPSQRSGPPFLTPPHTPAHQLVTVFIR